MPDFIYNGQAVGNVATTLLDNNFDVRCLRPWLSDDGKRSYVTRVVNGKDEAVLVRNATASLRKESWKLLDDAILKVAKERLQAVADLRGAGQQFVIPNGMGKTILETERMGDISDAIISMDGLRESEADRPQFDLTNLPLPIIHKDFHYSARQIAVSRTGGSPLDTTTAELAARKVAEQAEKLLLGVSSSYTYGGGTIYGYTNFTNRLTSTITAPTTGGWTPATLLAELLAMRQLAYDGFHYGPFFVYFAPAWDQYLDDDFSSAKGDNTVRERIAKINGFDVPKTLDFLTGFTILLVEKSSMVVREVVGMDITTVQWESHGGMRLNFKVMAILVPQLRADIDGNTGIVHGSV